jgi:cell wall-associated NlpC family hydrolase
MFSSPMSTRRRFLLPALAFVTSVVFVAGALSTVELVAGSDETASAAVLGHPKPFHRPARHAVPTLGERAARFALHEVGVPYRWGGESPSGFDCSGLVRWSYLRVGIDLPHSSYALYEQGRRVSAGHLKPGDVLFFDGFRHVGLYLGHGRMVHAPYTGRDVEVMTLSGWSGHFIAARRVAPA